MHRIFQFLGLAPSLEGLEDILSKVVAGKLSQSDAAQQIRRLAVTPLLPPWFRRLLQLCGGLFAVVGLGFAVYSLSFAFGTKETRGTVIKIISGSPVVEYVVDGIRLNFRSSISSSPARYNVGDQVSVLYRTANPSSAQLNTFEDRWLFPVAFTVSGTSLALLGTFLPKILSLLAGFKPDNHRSDSDIQPSPPSNV